MPRTETVLRSWRRSAIVLVEQVDRFTLRMVQDDGTVLLSDGEGLWGTNGCTWYGKAPEGWDDARAESVETVLRCEMELDYS